jgi:3-hydroxy-9,10-secoandrosta-1,3,5(10)-triene-9,17-dione monooxygenase reductase component
MGHFATGVAVVTALGASGEPVGTTVNAVTSVSLEPPLVLVCLDRASLTLQAVRAHQAFAINVLAEEQTELSVGFAQSGDRVPWRLARHRCGETGSPRLVDALATLECAVEHHLPGGDHEIVVGRVLDVEQTEDERGPLLFYRGAYASVSEAGAQAGARARAAREQAIGCRLPARAGSFQAFAHAEEGDGEVALALVHGDCDRRAALLHVHFACLLGDVFGSRLCRCHENLEAAIEEIVADGAGVVLYIKPAAGDAPLTCPGTRRLDAAIASGVLRAAGVPRVRPGASVHPALAGQLQALGTVVEPLEVAA